MAPFFVSMCRPMLLFVLMLAQCTICISQAPTNNRKNIVYLQAAGPLVAGLGLGYERYLNLNDRNRFSLRAGLGGVDHFTELSSFLGGSFIYGKRSNLEIGLNYLVNYDASTFRSTEILESKFKNGWQTLIGYRYQNWENGITFRVYYVPPVACCGTSIPVYGGASLGYTF